jgi:uncharacterized protein YjdB
MRYRKTAWATLGLAAFAACGGPTSIDDMTNAPPDSADLARAASVVVTLAVSSFPVGDSTSATAVVRDSRGRPLNNPVAWSSTNAAVASVSSSGVVTGVSQGSSSIIASSGNRSGSAVVTVTAPPIGKPGTVIDLRATATSASAAAISFTQVNDGAGNPASYDVRVSQPAITWGTAPSVTNGTCSAPLVGTATNGTMTCTVLGLAPATKYNFQLIAFRGALNTPSASFGSLSNVAEVTTPTASTTPVATTVSLAPTSASIPVGGSQIFVPTVRDQNGATMPCGTLGWTSQNAAVATVNATGSVLGVAAGTTTIRATCGSASGTATVTVTAAAPPPAPNVGDTLFFENWEANSFNKWQDGYKPATQKIISDGGAYEGTRYLDVTYSPGQDGGWLTTFFMPGYDSLYVRAYVKFSSGWTGGTKLLGFMGSRTDNMWSAFGTAGRCPTGTDFFTTSAVTEPNGGTSSLTPPVRIYSYYPGMAREPDGTTCWGRYGDGSEHYYAPTQMSLGTWHKVEFWVRINAVGQSNGAQRVWIDGRLEGEWTGIQLRTSAILKLNSLQLSFSSINPAAQHLYVDDILVLGGKPSP